MKNSGYTLDQTILIVAIIAVLITLIVITVGWSLLNRGQATKAVALIKQIEEANNKFFVTHNYWPEEGIMAANDDSWPAGGAPREQAIHVLVDPRYLETGSNHIAARMVQDHQNLVHGLRDDDARGYLIHPFADDGRISQRRLTLNASDPIGTITSGVYHVIRFRNVPYDLAVEMDEIIDGEVNFDEGRFVIRDNNNNGLPRNCRANAATVTSGLVNVCYVANLSE